MGGNTHAPITAQMVTRATQVSPLAGFLAVNLNESPPAELAVRRSTENEPLGPCVVERPVSIGDRVWLSWASDAGLVLAQ